MSAIRKELVYAVLDKAIISIDYNIHNDFHKAHEFKKQMVLNLLQMMKKLLQ